MPLDTARDYAAIAEQALLSSRATTGEDAGDGHELTRYELAILAAAVAQVKATFEQTQALQDLATAIKDGLPLNTQTLSALDVFSHAAMNLAQKLRD